MATIVNNARIKGNALTLSLGGTDYWSDIASYSLEPSDKDSDAVTFADAAAGSASGWKLKGKAIQSMAAASLWRKAWSSTGTTVDFKLAPFGNEQPSAEEPHFTGKVKIGAKPPVGGDAGDKPFDWEFEWDVVGEPELVTGA